MLDQNELIKYFSKSQQQDMIELDITCQNTPRGRIRRARPRKVKPDHIPRPVNSFMSYRTEKQSIIKKLLPTANHRDISKMVAKWWHNIGPAEKSIYVDLAKKAKEVHTEKFPDYTFRPKCKSRKPKNAANIKNQDADDNLPHSISSTQPDTCARTRLYVPNLKSQQFVIPPISNDIFTFRNVSSSSASNAHTADASNSDRNITNLYQSNNSNMYNDEVLFDAKEDKASSYNFWDTSYNSGEQVMANAYATISPVQNTYPYYDYPALSYHPSPLPSVLSHEPIQAIDPNALSNQFMPSTTTTAFASIDVSSFAMLPHGNDVLYGNMRDGPINSDTQLFSGFNYEITPYSQAMSTPMLDYSNSPASPINNNNQLVTSAGAQQIIQTIDFTQGHPSPELLPTYNISNNFFEAHQEIFAMFQEGSDNNCLSNDASPPTGPLSLVQW